MISDPCRKRLSVPCWTGRTRLPLCPREGESRSRTRCPGLLAYLGAKYGGDFERFRQADLDAGVEKLKSGAAMEEITKDMKYYAYYREAYGAVLDGMVGYFEQESGNNKVWLRKYGLKVALFNPGRSSMPGDLAQT